MSSTKSCIFSYSNSLKNYRNSENKLRNYIEEEIEDTKKDYFEDLIMLDNSLFNLINIYNFWIRK